jgi:hypothetical protein
MILIVRSRATKGQIAEMLETHRFYIQITQELLGGV